MTDPNEARWLRACLPPDQPERTAGLEAEMAMAVAASPLLVTRPFTGVAGRRITPREQPLGAACAMSLILRNEGRWSVTEHRAQQLAVHDTFTERACRGGKQPGPGRRSRRPRIRECGSRSRSPHHRRSSRSHRQVGEFGRSGGLRHVVSGAELGGHLYPGAPDTVGEPGQHLNCRGRPTGRRGTRP
ncbi:hypothetical protein B0T44_21345 [Nocardia donostiensis]|uniref:Uncharacterized protein n=1 Tax=Nocardia donostiensis TaxID=1538463 RepID=A0A1W0B6H8_9NOCA|nr:hypothetical protein B0T46_22785 [Nocardia donostiensis]OQS14249.1 hypothetical protein B0T36_14630 [Nocardia donostiensis]OQS18137.1 hypothetical protein B0T44_21345 [Nocardia donostiensis]